MKKYISYFTVTLIALSILSCSARDNTSPIKSEKNIKTIKADEIRKSYGDYLKSKMQVSDSVLEAELRRIKYDVVFTKVTYEAIDPFGETKTLSGLIGYPVLPAGEKDKQLSIVSIQHGTLSYESEAPSLNKFKDVGSLGNALSLIPPTLTEGYIVVVPDYFGYGADEKNIHYYEVRPSLAEATRKLIEAIPAFAKEKSLNTSPDKLYLFGYSEGGFATMSTLKSFSENSGGFTNITTVAGAGAYDKVATATHVIQQTSGEAPHFTASYLWVLTTYNNVYGINRDLNLLVQPGIEPVAKEYIGTDKIMQSNKIPSAPSQAFNPAFVEGIVKQTDKAYMNALNDNNVSDFNAIGSVELVHGTNDTWVPTFNTDSAFIRLQHKGVNVNKYLYEGGTHSSTYPVFVLRALRKL